MFLMRAALYLIAAFLIFEALTKLFKAFNAYNDTTKGFIFLAAACWGLWGEFAVPFVVLYGLWRFVQFINNNQQPPAHQQ